MQERSRATTRLIASPSNTAGLNTISDAFMGRGLKRATTWETGKVAWLEKNQDFFYVVLIRIGLQPHRECDKVSQSHQCVEKSRHVSTSSWARDPGTFLLPEPGLELICRPGVIVMELAVLNVMHAAREMTKIDLTCETEPCDYCCTT